MSDSTPMMQQYLSIKEQYRDAVLFFRLGDFYEMFKSDAREVSQILNITLTKRHGIEMCGIPYHAAQNYIHRLLKAGKKIAICEQTKMPGKGQKIAKREVVEVITPGTVVDQDFLSDKSNNYLAALGLIKETFSFSFIDLSTGEFIAMDIPHNRIDQLKQELFRLAVKEIIIQESLAESSEMSFLIDSSVFINRYPDWYFDSSTSLVRLKQQFNVASLKGFGFNDSDIHLVSAGVLLEYIKTTSQSLLPHITTLKKHSETGFVSLDEATRKNLELTRNLHDGTESFSLIEVLDQTKTSMGGRTLKKWLQQPLFNKGKILFRQERVTYFYRNQTLLSQIRENLSSVLDIERLTSRVAMDKAHAKDLLSLKISLQNAASINDLLENLQNGLFLSIQSSVKKLTPIMKLIDESITEDPSILLTEGRLIKKGYNHEVDKLRQLRDNSRQILDNYLQEIKENTGISNIRIKYNKIIGYFFEVSKTQIDMVPDDFIRRQSLVNGERFTTDRLISIETEINNSAEKIIELEKSLFLEIRDKVKEQVSNLLAFANEIAELDVYQSHAFNATIKGYICPDISDENNLFIQEGRHPVVEHHLPPGEFIPNDITMKCSEQPFLLVTGPNMAGKSTYLRQVALLVLMAQTGSYIPAQKAEIGLVDRIFCRVGASDNLARGESTFLVEMNETANILRNGTGKSLIIMDEVGRGTSTKDGLSIAWSIVEYLLEVMGSRTLFATHYHELTQIENQKLKNVSMQIKESGETITFLKKIKDGPSNSSYGIHVASLAGLPADVIKRARDILTHINKDTDTLKDLPKPKTGQSVALFPEEELIADEILSLNPDKITPLEALEKIYTWKKKLKN